MNRSNYVKAWQSILTAWCEMIQLMLPVWSCITCLMPRHPSPDLVSVCRQQLPIWQFQKSLVSSILQKIMSIIIFMNYSVWVLKTKLSLTTIHTQIKCVTNLLPGEYSTNNVCILTDIENCCIQDRITYSSLLSCKSDLFW